MYDVRFNGDGYWMKEMWYCKDIFNKMEVFLNSCYNVVRKWRGFIFFYKCIEYLVYKYFWYFEEVFVNFFFIEEFFCCDIFG